MKTKDKGVLASVYGAFRDGAKGDLVSAVGTKVQPNPTGNKPHSQFRQIDPRRFRGKSRK